MDKILQASSGDGNVSFCFLNLCSLRAHHRGKQEGLQSEREERGKERRSQTLQPVPFREPLILHLLGRIESLFKEQGLSDSPISQGFLLMPGKVCQEP